jgi:F420-dependent oxidoreductase-like protein
MRIGLSGGGASPARLVEQAQEAERDGFTSLWYSSGMAGDPLLPMLLAGRATDRIELGTAIMQTYPVHPVLQAGRAATVASFIGRGVTIGLGVAHQPTVEQLYGYSYATPGEHAETYVRTVQAVLHGDVATDNPQLAAAIAALPNGAPVSVLLAALGPRMLRIAGSLADGTILWLATPKAIAEHIVPRITTAAEGRSPRIVAGVPIAVHDDVREARDAAAAQYGGYGTLPNYQRILAIGGAASPADAVIVGDEAQCATQVRALFEAGATDAWLVPFPVGSDRASSRRRTRDLLRELASE